MAWFCDIGLHGFGKRKFDLFGWEGVRITKIDLGILSFMKFDNSAAMCFREFLESCLDFDEWQATNAPLVRLERKRARAKYRAEYKARYLEYREQQAEDFRKLSRERGELQIRCEEYRTALKVLTEQTKKGEVI